VGAVDPVHPRVVAATRAQLRHREGALARGARPVGWKLALAFAEIEAVIGDAAVVGYVTSESVRPAGAQGSFGADRAAAPST
jgi:hypothetical protein